MKTLSRLTAAFAISTAAAVPAHAGPIPMKLILLLPGEKAQVDEFTTRLQALPYFANAKDASSGSNVMLVVSVAQVPTGGGAAAAATTGLLAATTLGLIPAIENKDISVHYEVRANQIVVASFDYYHNFTSVSNLWSGMGKMPEDARQWILKTLDELGPAVQASAALTHLQAEYDSYFPK